MATKAGRGPGNSAKAGNQARRFEETIYFHEAALSGYSYDQIAGLASTRFGRPIGRELVRRRLVKYREEMVAENVEELRGVQVARLDRYLVTLDETILAADRVEEIPLEGGRIQVLDSRPAKIAAIATALRIEERRAKLLGLDSPVQAEIEVTTSSPIDLSVQALAAELAADPEAR